MNKNSYIFGPVPSRRLGRSLGIDLVPFKVCSFDCVYCQLGRTTRKTIECREYVPFEEVTSQLAEKLAQGIPADYITLAGSGEPTLYSRLGELIDFIKELTEIPVAVITNGSMLWKPLVRKALMRADLVVPSLDFTDEDTFRRVNRPCAGVSAEKIIRGLKDFISEFKNECKLEIFLLDGINTDPECIEDFSRIIVEIGAECIQLNTVARPACENFARPVSEAAMRDLLKKFPSGTEIIANFSAEEKVISNELGEDDIINLLRRRPCTARGIADSLCAHHHEVLKMLEQMLRKKTVISEEKAGDLFYFSVY